MPSSISNSAPSKRRVSPLDIVACVLPVLIVVAMLVTYLIDPGFYAAYVLEPLRREFQAVEIMTLLFLGFGAPLLLIATVRQWRLRWDPGGWLALLVIGLVALATVFFLGEEADWGDTFFGWTNKEEGKLSDVYALNLHNNIPIRGLGSLFLMSVFFILPTAWALRNRPALRDWLKPRAGLRRAVPEGPVVFAMVFAFTWRVFKKIYIVSMGGKDNLGAYGDGGFYWGFVEQINEQKEMLIALALLFYAIYRVRPSLWRADPPRLDP